MKNPSSTITFRTEAPQKAALDRIATTLNRDRSFVLNEALRAYIEAYEWQIREIKAALNEADAGDFAAPEEVEAVFKKLKRKA